MSLLHFQSLFHLNSIHVHVLQSYQPDLLLALSQSMWRLLLFVVLMRELAMLLEQKEERVLLLQMRQLPARTDVELLSWFVHSMTVNNTCDLIIEQFLLACRLARYFFLLLL